MQVLSITVGVAAASWAAVYVAMLLLAPLLPMTRGRAPAEVRVIASLAGTVAIARSPASAVHLDPPQIPAQNPFLQTRDHPRTMRRCAPGLRHGAADPNVRPYGCICAQIAVLKETAGKGTFCSLVMAVVVVKDILVFCCFAVNLEMSTVVSTSRPMRPPSLVLQQLNGMTVRNVRLR